MKYIRQTYGYYLDKCPYLWLITVVPSLLLAFALAPSDALYYLMQYDNLTTTSFADFYVAMHSVPFSFFWVGFIGLAIMVFFVAILFGTIDRHMRIGEFTVSFRRAKTRLNYNLLTALKFTLATTVIVELGNLAVTIAYYAYAMIFGSGIVWLVLSTLTMCLFGLIDLFLLCAIMLWSPFMLHTGLKTSDAFKMGWRQMGGKTKYAVFVMVTGMMPFLIAMLLTGLFDTGAIVMVVLDGLMFTAIIPLYISMSYVVFYDVTGTERMDLETRSIWSKRFFDK